MTLLILLQWQRWVNHIGQTTRLRREKSANRDVQNSQQQPVAPALLKAL
jgi:hypothetical protein